MEKMSHRFGVSIGRIDDPRDVDKDDAAISFPFLDSKMLDVNMASTRSGAILIDDVNGSFVINIEASGTRFGEAKVGENHAKAMDHFGSQEDGKKFSFSAGGSNGRLELTLVGNSAGAKINKDPSDQTAGLEVSAMGSVKVGTKFFISGKRRKIRGVRGSERNGNVRKTREGCRARIDNAPILSKAKVASNILESLVM